MHSSFLFLSANTPWVYALADRLGRRHAVHAVRFFDWRVYRANQPTWPPGALSDHLARTTRVMPTGYTGVLEPVLRPLLAWMIRRWRQQLRARSGSSPTVVAPYPYLAPWVRDVPGQHLVYYNLDDYALYRPERADRIRDREDELIQRAHRTLCLSVHQVEHLRDRHPDRADRIPPLSPWRDGRLPQPVPGDSARSTNDHVCRQSHRPGRLGLRERHGRALPLPHVPFRRERRPVSIGSGLAARSDRRAPAPECGFRGPRSSGGRDGLLLVGRRQLDPVRYRSPVQPGVVSHEGYGRDWKRASRRQHGRPRVSIVPRLDQHRAISRGSGRCSSQRRRTRPRPLRSDGFRPWPNMGP